MTYNIFLSRYSNNDKIIKNSFSRRTSLGMSSYISDQMRVDMTTRQIFTPKKGRDQGEVEFSALILPRKTPKNILDEIMGEKEYVIKNIKNRFVKPPIKDYEDHYFLQDSERISYFWSENDKNISELETSGNKSKNPNNKMRLYNLYLFASPVAHKHFPKELGVTYKDLREIDEKAIYEVAHEFLLSKGLALELGRHQNKENIIHYHIQTPARVMNFIYEVDEVKINVNDFKSWLSKSVLANKKANILSQKINKEKWLEKYKDNPSDYNKKRYIDWLRKFENSMEEHEEILDIIAGASTSGMIYSDYLNKYRQKLFKDKSRENSHNNLFAKTKGPVELFLDTPRALDKMKKRYADVLNELLIEEGIIKPNTQLYTYVESMKDIITIKEARMWNLPEKDREHVNREIKKIKQIDLDFEKNLKKSKEMKNKPISKQTGRVLVHKIKNLYKKSFQLHKKTIALDFEELNDFVKYWVNKVTHIKNNYDQYIGSLMNNKIFNFTWKSTKLENIIHEDKKEVNIEKYKDFEVVEGEQLDEALYQQDDELDNEELEEIIDHENDEDDNEYIYLERYFSSKLMDIDYRVSQSNNEVSVIIHGHLQSFSIFRFQEFMYQAFVEKMDLESVIEDYIWYEVEKKIEFEEQDNNDDYEIER